MPWTYCLRSNSIFYLINNCSHSVAWYFDYIRVLFFPLHIKDSYELYLSTFCIKRINMSERTLIIYGNFWEFLNYPITLWFWSYIFLLIFSNKMFRCLNKRMYEELTSLKFKWVLFAYRPVSTMSYETFA